MASRRRSAGLEYPNEHGRSREERKLPAERGRGEAGTVQDVPWENQAFQGARLDFDRAETVRLADEAEIREGLRGRKDFPKAIYRKRLAVLSRKNAEEAGERQRARQVANESYLATAQICEQERRNGPHFHLVPGVTRAQQNAPLQALRLAVANVAPHRRRKKANWPVVQ